MVKLKRLWGLLAMIMVAMLSISVVSCGDDDDEDDGYGSGSQIENNGNSSTMDAIYENQLSGTSWKQSSCAIYYSDGSFNYTTTQTSVTVKFYTNERASSATIKYGEYSASSSASATITNKEISATISGLKKGTKYYVKCTARNSSGSVTSDDYPVRTNY